MVRSDAVLISRANIDLRRKGNKRGGGAVERRSGAAPAKQDCLPAYRQAGCSLLLSTDRIGRLFNEIVHGCVEFEFDDVMQIDDGAIFPILQDHGVVRQENQNGKAPPRLAGGTRAYADCTAFQRLK